MILKSDSKETLEPKPLKTKILLIMSYKEYLLGERYGDIPLSTLREESHGKAGDRERTLRVDVYILWTSLRYVTK